MRLGRAQGVALLALAVVAIGGSLWLASQAGRLDRIASRWRMLDLGLSGNPAPTPPPVSEWPALVRDDLVIPYDHSHYFLKDRGAAYLLAVKCVLERPLFGYGAGGWLAAASQHSNDPALRTFFLYLQFTHQDYLQTLVEWGLAGGSLAGFLLFGGLWRATVKKRGLPMPLGEMDPWLVGGTAGLAAVLIQSAIDFPLQIPANAFYASVLVGLCWSRSRVFPLIRSHARHKTTSLPREYHPNRSRI